MDTKKKKNQKSAIDVGTLVANAKPKNTGKKKKARSAETKKEYVHFASQTYRPDSLRGEFGSLVEHYRDRWLKRLSESPLMDDAAKRRAEWLKRRLLSGRAGTWIQSWLTHGKS